MAEEQSSSYVRRSARIIARREFVSGGETGRVTRGGSSVAAADRGRGSHAPRAVRQSPKKQKLTDSERVALGDLLAKAIDPAFAKNVLAKVDWKPTPLTATQSRVIEKWASLFPILLEHDENSTTGFNIPQEYQNDIDRRSLQLPVFVRNLIECLNHPRRLFPANASQQALLQSVLTETSSFTIADSGTADVTPMYWSPLLNQGEIPFHWRNVVNAKFELSSEECMLYLFNCEDSSLELLLNRLQSIDGHEVSISHQVFHSIVGKSFEDLVLCFQSVYCLQDHIMPCLEPIKYDGSCYTTSALRPDEQASFMMKNVNRDYNLLSFCLSEYKMRSNEFSANIQKCRLLTYANYVTFVRLARHALKTAYLDHVDIAWKHSLDRLAHCQFCLPLIYGHSDLITIELLYVTQIPESDEATSSTDESHYSSSNVTVSWFDIGVFSLKTTESVRSAMTMVRNLRDYLFDVLRIDRLVSFEMEVELRRLWKVRLPVKSFPSSRPSSGSIGRSSPTGASELFEPLGGEAQDVSKVALKNALDHFHQDFEILSRFVNTFIAFDMIRNDSESAVIRGSIRKDSSLRRFLKKSTPRVVVMKVGPCSDSQMEHELLARKHLNFLKKKSLPCIVMPETYCSVSLGDGNMAIIMEDCGTTLAEVEIGTWEELRDITMALLYTLIQLHSMHIVHCDVNAWNVAVCSGLSENRENISKNWLHRMHSSNANTATVLLDYGLSEVIINSHLPKGNRGAKGFIAPEVEAGHEFDFAADIWSTATTITWVQENCHVKNIPLQFTALLSTMLNASPLHRPIAQQAFALLSTM